MSDNRTALLSLIPIIFFIFFSCSRSPRLEGPLPNILLIVMDAARADHFSCYGYSRLTTPNIDRVAAEGLRFTQAVASSCWTLPSHTSLFTGLLPWENGTHIQHQWLIERIPTLAEILKTKGYRTAGLTNNPTIGAESNLHRGFDLFISVWKETISLSPRKRGNTEKTNELVRQFLENDESQAAPFFIFINYMDVHHPYDPPQPYRSLYLKPNQKVTALIDSVNHNHNLVKNRLVALSDKDFEILRALYDGSMNYLDAKIQELLEYLKQRGLYDNTLVIITSDHGEAHGDHGLLGHRVFLYRPLIHIPLIIHHGKLTRSPGVREVPVSICDIFHTIVRLLGMENLGAPTGAKVSYLLDPIIPKKPCYSLLKEPRISLKMEAFNDLRSIWTPEGYHYILCENESYECFDLSKDFEEQHNLCPSSISKEEVITAVTGMEERLLPFIEGPEDLLIAREQRIDPQQEQVLRALGYVDIGGPDISQQIQIEHPHVMEHLKTGVFFFSRDSLPAAEWELHTALAINPNNIKAPVYLGETLYKQKKYQEALRVVRSLIGRTNEEVRVRLLLGKILVDSGKDDQALEQFFKIAEIDPSEPNARINAANLLMIKGDSKTAEFHLQKLLTFHPDNLHFLENVIKLHLQYRNWEAARRLLLEEIKKNPVPRVYFNLSQVCLNLGKKEEARGYLQTLLNENLPPQIHEQVEKQLQELNMTK
ncbi:MAG TPA: sulfatase-like hydrolase/transferase [archaeon]|nr:sulfatase-like hydrolase/transferase [archaeon]